MGDTPENGERTRRPAQSPGGARPRLGPKVVLLALVELWFPRAAFAESGSARRTMIAVTVVFGLTVAIAAFVSGRTATGLALVVAFTGAVALMIVVTRRIERRPHGRDD